MGSMVRLALYATERLGAGDITRIIGANPPMTVSAGSVKWPLTLH